MVLNFQASVSILLLISLTWHDIFNKLYLK